MNRRHKKLAIMNHKGGVGKTTLTYNLAAAFTELGKRVLLVDADPQCNLSTYVIDPDFFDKVLDESETEFGVTLWSALRPVSEGAGNYKTVTPFETPVVGWMLPGDIALSAFERDLSDFFADCYQRRIRGFNGTSALSRVVNEVASEYEIDYVLYDTGPNIGALNQAVFLDCDHFLVSAALDLFSVRAIHTFGATAASWIKDWEVVTSLAPDNAPLLVGRPSFIGYIPQGFRVYRGMVRAQQDFLARIDNAIQTELIARLSQIDEALVACGPTCQLPQVKSFSSLASKSQETGEALFNVSTATPEQREEARDVFFSLAHSVISRTE